jgi:hypothetical protein
MQLVLNDDLEAVVDVPAIILVVFRYTSTRQILQWAQPYNPEQALTAHFGPNRISDNDIIMGQGCLHIQSTGHDGPARDASVIAKLPQYMQWLGHANSRI